MNTNYFIHENSFSEGGLDIFNAPVGENNIDMLSFVEKTKSYIEEYKYNLSLAVSKFKLLGAKENGISENFFFMVLIETGSICGFRPTIPDGNAKALKNIVFQPYVATGWNYYAEPTRVDIVPYYQNGVTFENLGLRSRNLSAEDFEIVWLNNTRIGFAGSLAYEARMCAMLEQCFYNNVLAKSIGLILEGKHNDLNDLKQLTNKILNQNGIFAFNVKDRPDANELIRALELNVEWLGDKITEAKKNLRAELHERLGITHAPYEKKERLTNVEIQTQNEASDLISQSTLNTINSRLDIINDKFELETPLKVVFTDAGIDSNIDETENIEKGGDG